MAESSPPIQERGKVADNGAGLLSWRSWIDTLEYAPELAWPANVAIYRKMFTGDSQIAGLRAGTIQPIERFYFYLDKNGSRPEVWGKMSRDYGLPVEGEEPGPVGRMRNRFKFSEHLHTALDFLMYGHYPFEQVGEVDPAKYGDRMWHPRKLAPRPPWTIGEINVEDDGGLKSIKQALGLNPPDLPVSNLIWYAWDMEPGNWVGTSILRACFRNWIVKDRLIRVDARKHDRTGMGVPWLTAPAGADDDEIARLSALAQAMRTGDTAGGAGPMGSKLELVGTSGTIPDTVTSLDWHDNQMARRFLMMFFGLSQGESAQGSYALGTGFMDFFAFAQEAIAQKICDVFTEHQLEDDCDWNFGEDEQCPILRFRRTKELPTEALAELVKEGLVSVDPELESVIRQRYDLPKAEPAPAPPAPPSPELPPSPDGAQPEAPVTASGGRRTAAAEPDLPSPVALPARTLRRQPYDHEVRAAVDFAQMEGTFVSARDQLVNEVRQRQQGMIAELHDAIVSAGGDLGKLSAIECSPASEDIILVKLQQLADAGVSAAETEAAAQGLARVKKPNLLAIEQSLTQRAGAVDSVLARSLSETASRKALEFTGGGLSPADVAAKVRDHLSQLSPAYLERQLGGALNAAQNTGRKAVMRANGADRIYASELLDSNTCSECVAKDGQEYLSMDDAEADYPTGGYSECEGGPNCRGTLVATYGEAT